MSSGAGEKLPKGKTRKSVPQKTAKAGKGKDRISVSENRFRGDGVKFKCKLIGSLDVSGPKGDSMCAEGIKKLKAQAKQLNKEIGEHKQKITLFIMIKGITIMDEKTQIIQHVQPINKISFITHDPEDKKIFGYVCSQPCTTGHKLFAIKCDKSAGIVTGTLYDLFQVVFKLRKDAESKKKVLNNAVQVSNGPNQQSSDGIYEVPFKNGNGSNKSEKHSQQLEHEYAIPTASSSRDPHYKVPCAKPIETSPYPNIGDSQKTDVKEPEQESKLPTETPLRPEDNTSQDVGFFSPSVFESVQNEAGMAETASLSSAADVHVFRSDSVSSASSEAFESRNADSRSSSLNQPPGNETLPPVNESSGSFQAAFATFNDSAAVTFSEMQSNTSENATGDKNVGDVPLDLTPLDEACKGGTHDVPLDVPLNHDPFAPAEILPGKEGSIPSEATDSFAAFDVAFGNVESTRDGEGETESIAIYNDPSAPSEGFKGTNAPENAEGFEADFDSTQLPSSSLNLDLSEGQMQETNELDNKEEPSQDTEQQFSVSWDNVFVTEETSSAVEKMQNLDVSGKQRSWKETFTSDTSNESGKQDFTASTSFSWDEAFGTVTSQTADSSSTNIVQDAFSWDDAFGKKVAESSPLEFDSSPFDDAFSPTFVEKKEKVSHLTTMKEPDMLQASKPTDTPLFGDTGFTASALPGIPSDSSEDKADSQHPVSSKDDFEELSIGFSTSAAGIEKKDSELGKPVVEASDAETGTSSSELPDEFQADFSQLSSDASLKNLEKPQFARDIEKGKGLDSETRPMPSDDCFTDVKQESDDGRTGLVLGDTTPQFHTPEAKIPSLEKPVSPSIPPPLPPRPVVSPPPLPARPTSVSSGSPCTSTGKSPGSPQVATESPKSNSPHQLKIGWGRKPPPAPPPRVDLHEKPKESGKMDGLGNLFSSGVVGRVVEGSSTTSATKHEKPLSNAPWPDVRNEDKRSDVSDPFSEDFFTNFDFPQETTSTSTASIYNDPFASTQSVDPFAAPFGDQDAFASFPPAQKDNSLDDLDPFSGDLSDSFTVFPCKDPFSDISDPFADRGVLSNDPFGDNPRKVNPGETISLNESLVASHEEADSFA